MESRNDALVDSTDQTRLRLQRMADEKEKLTQELNEASLKLSQTNIQNSSLVRENGSLKSEVELLQESVNKRFREIEDSKKEAIATDNELKETRSKLDQGNNLDVIYFFTLFPSFLLKYFQSIKTLYQFQ